MAQPVFLGVDVGTSSTKGVLVTPEGELLYSAVREHQVDRPAVGHVEMDPRIWWEEFQSIASELTGRSTFAVLAVGVSGIGPCLALVDEAHEPVRPAILYGVDMRAGAQIDALNAELGADAILERASSTLTSQAVGPKIQWVRDEEPERYARARRFFMPASFLAYQLTGQYVLDHHSASQCTPLYDGKALGWYEPWVERIAPGLEMPPLRWPGEIAGQVRAEVAGIPAGTPVITGTIDAWSEAVSVDAQNPGDLMLMYGTTLFLIATVEDRLTSELMWGTVGAFEGTRNLAGGMAASGAITAWCKDLTGADYGTLLTEAADSPAGAGGLIALPYFAGERTPIFDPDARGVIAGLSLAHSRGDLYRAILEGTGYAVRHNVEALRAAGAEIRRVVAVGGGTQGTLWTQIVSDLTGLAQVIPSKTIGASFGAAYLAAKAVGEADIAQWNPPSEIREPHEHVRGLYDDLYAQYLELYPATKPVVHAMAKLQRGE